MERDAHVVLGPTSLALAAVTAVPFVFDALWPALLAPFAGIGVGFYAWRYRRDGLRWVGFAGWS